MTYTEDEFEVEVASLMQASGLSRESAEREVREDNLDC